jgi:hypothetical protein
MPRGTSPGSKETQFKPGNTPWNKWTHAVQSEEVAKAIADIQIGMARSADLMNKVYDKRDVSESIRELNGLIDAYVKSDKKLSKQSQESIQMMRNEIQRLVKKMDVAKENSVISKNLIHKFESIRTSMDIFNKNIETHTGNILDNINTGNDTEKDNANQLFFINDGIQGLQTNLKDLETVLKTSSETSSETIKKAVVDSQKKLIDAQVKIEEKKEEKTKFEQRFTKAKSAELADRYESAVGDIQEATDGIAKILKEFGEDIKSKPLFKTIEEQLNSAFSGAGKNKKEIKGIISLLQDLNDMKLRQAKHLRAYGTPVPEKDMKAFMEGLATITIKLNKIVQASKFIKNKDSIKNVQKLQEYIEFITTDLQNAKRKMEGLEPSQIIQEVIDKVEEGNISWLETRMQENIDRLNNISELEKKFREKSSEAFGTNFSDSFRDMIASNLENAIEEYENKRSEVSSVRENKENFKDLLENIEAIRELAEKNTDLFEDIDKEFLENKLPELISTLKKSQVTSPTKSLVGGLLKKTVDLLEIPLLTSLSDLVEKRNAKLERKKDIQRNILKNTSLFGGNAVQESSGDLDKNTTKDTIKQSSIGGIFGALLGGLVGGPAGAAVIGSLTASVPIIANGIKSMSSKLDEIKENQEEQIESDEERDKRNGAFGDDDSASLGDKALDFLGLTALAKFLKKSSIVTWFKSAATAIIGFLSSEAGIAMLSTAAIVIVTAIIGKYLHNRMVTEHEDTIKEIEDMEAANPGLLDKIISDIEKEQEETAKKLKEMNLFERLFGSGITNEMYINPEANADLVRDRMKEALEAATIIPNMGGQNGESILFSKSKNPAVETIERGMQLESMANDNNNTVVIPYPVNQKSSGGSSPVMIQESRVTDFITDQMLVRLFQEGF